jgi:hypothetical protein
MRVRRNLLETDGLVRDRCHTTVTSTTARYLIHVHYLLHRRAAFVIAIAIGPRGPGESYPLL